MDSSRNAMSFDSYMDLGSSSSTAVRQRTYYKCDFCRRRKIKCLPQARRWPEGRSSGDRCQPCVASGQSCGPNKLCDRPQQTLHSPSQSASTPFTPFPRPASAIQAPGSFNELSYTTDLSSSLVNSDWELEPAWTQQGDEGSLRDKSGIRPQMRPGASKYPTQPPPKTRNVVKSKLNDLGCLRALFEYLTTRHQASLREHPIRRFHIFSDVEKLIVDLLHSIQIRFDAICEDILGQLPVALTLERELFLRRLFDNIEWFLHVENFAVQSEEQHEDFSTWALQRRVAEQLVQFYEASEEVADAMHFRLELIRLRTRKRAPDRDEGSQDEAVAFMKMSHQVSQAFRALGFHRRCRGVSEGAQRDVPATHLAVYHGRPGTASTLLQDSLYDGDEMDILDRRLSHLAVETGNKELLHTLLERPDGRDDRDVYHMTPLAMAARIGDVDMFTALHNAGYDLNVCDMAGRSVLCIAAGAGNREVVEYMLRAGCNPAQTYDLEQAQTSQSEFSNAYSALHAAAAGGHMSIVKLLVQHNASAVYVSNDRTPSQEARAYRHFEVADFLHAIQTQGLLTLEQQLKEHAKVRQTQRGGSVAEQDLFVSTTAASPSYSPAAFEIVPNRSERTMQRQPSVPCSTISTQEVSTAPSVVSNVIERSRKRMRDFSRPSSPAVSDTSANTSAGSANTVRQSSLSRPSPSLHSARR